MFRPFSPQVTTPYKLSQEPVEGSEDVADPVGLNDLSFVPSDLLSHPDFQWQSKGGLAETVRESGLAFAKKNNLQAIKVLLIRKAEGEASKAKLQDKVMAKYRQFLEEEVSVKCIKSSKEIDSTNTIRYRGYILEENIRYERAVELFTVTREEEIDLGPSDDQEGEGEGGEDAGGEAAGGEEEVDSPGEDASPANRKKEIIVSKGLR